MFIDSEWYFRVDDLISIKTDGDILIHSHNGFEPNGPTDAIIFQIDDIFFKIIKINLIEICIFSIGIDHLIM